MDLGGAGGKPTHRTHERKTLESRYADKLLELKDDQEALVDYCLKTAPFIKEYFEDHDDKETLFNGFVKVEGGSRRHTVLTQYLAEVEGDAAAFNNRVSSDSQYTCTRCRGTKTFVDSKEAMLVCTECGGTQPFFECSGNSVTFDQKHSQYKLVTYCAYKRNNHFSEWINSLMGREGTVIPEEVLQAVRAEFKKTRVTQRSDITPLRVREFLRKLKLQKWYEHTHSICHALGGMPAPAMSPELEARLKEMFAQIQEPFDAVVHEVDPTRKNFLSYSYCLYKFCELLGEDGYLPYFSLLKNGDKLHKMDCIWKRICERLRWEYFPSI